MTVSKVQYTSRKLAEQLRGSPYMAVISITDPTTPEARLDPLFRHVLRLSFFDAVPADEYMPALPGLFDRHMAAQIRTFVEELHAAPFEISLMVHCEYGVSRSAAVALFAEALTGAPLDAREFTYEANQWVIDLLEASHPGLSIDVPTPLLSRERRHAQRA
ncbi:MAG TPA: hypothetical protein VK165_02815 [Azonexus sp.]|nr:hypothetical protein [Azonexus sp.]